MPVYMPHWPKPLGSRPTEIDLKLNRVVRVLSKLGNPQDRMPGVIHVAGTNGKGSTISFLRKILEFSGYKVNVYTSPHLIYFNERIVINNHQIGDRELYELLEEIRVVSTGENLTFFEGTTLAAILGFSRSNADFTLLETGMGGRLDATNVCAQPLMTVITSVDMDHTNYLGDSLEKIAYEKAGIMKQGVSCVISRQHNDVRKVLEEVAIIKKVPVFRGDYEWFVSNNEDKLDFTVGDKSVEYLMPNMPGKHQVTNAGNAIAVATLLANKCGYEKIDHAAVDEGVASAYWPARLEKISNKENELLSLLPESWSLYIDGAHNPAGAKVLSEWLDSEKVHLIFGTTKDKDAHTFLRNLASNAETISVLCVKGEPRSQTVEEMIIPAKKVGVQSFQRESLKDAILHIVNYDSSPSKKIVICGSLFLYRDLKSYEGKDLYNRGYSL